MKDEYAMELVKRDKYKEGPEEGREEGRELEKRHLARKLLNQGLEPKWIAELTGLTLETIQQLEQ